MDMEAYEEPIENASQILVEAMVDEDFEELLEEGRQLDAKVHKVVMKLGQQMVTQLFELLGRAVENDCKAEGMTVQRRPSVQFGVLFGRISVDSPYLYDRETGDSARPLKEAFGVRGNSYSLSVDRALSEFGKETSFERAADRFEEHYGWHVGRTSLLRRTEQAAASAEQFVDERFDRWAQQFQDPDAKRDRLADELFVQADGCLIRCGQLMTAAEARKKAEDPDEQQRLAGLDDDKVVRLQQWKEVRTGLARRPEQVEPIYVCRRDDWPVVVGQLFAVAAKLGGHFETDVVATGDGARGLKEAMEEWFAHLQYILDRPHLKHHLIDTAEHLQTTDLEGLEEWVDDKLDLIHQGRVTEVIGQLTSLLDTLDTEDKPVDEQDDSPSRRLERLIDHLTRFSNCVDYETYQENDWPIGSGEVESAHRHVPQRRLKLAGATWREENLNPMLSLRVIAENGWWDDFWDWEADRRAA